ncbi:MAG: glycosyltransferase family 39 protein [Spirosomataceae bacterium]
MTESFSSKKVYLGVCLTGFTLLFFQVLSSPAEAKYDEILFYPNLLLFQQYGLSVYSLLNIKNQAPGPLYELIHSFFSSFTALQFPAVRYVNFLLLVLMTVLLYRILQEVFKSEDAFIKAFSLMTVPMLWSIGGLALTEIPTLFFGVLTLYFYFAISPARTFTANTVYAVLCGFSLGLTILGRTQFLVIFLTMGLFVRSAPKSLFFIRSLTLLIAAFVCFPVFYLWKGLTPPTLRYQSETNLFYGFLALSYSSMAFFILAPSWFYIKRRHLPYYAALLCAALAVNLKFELYHYLGFNSLLSRLKNPELLHLLSLVIPCLFVPVAWLFLSGFFYRLREQRNHKEQTFLYVSFLLLILSSVKVSHIFSPRYVAQALPLAVLMAAPYFTLNRWRVGIGIAGIAIGSFSLNAYYVKKYNYDHWSYRVRDLGPRHPAGASRP